MDEWRSFLKNEKYISGFDEPLVKWEKISLSHESPSLPDFLSFSREAFYNHEVIPEHTCACWETSRVPLSPLE